MFQSHKTKETTIYLRVVHNNNHYPPHGHTLAQVQNCSYESTSILWHTPNLGHSLHGLENKQRVKMKKHYVSCEYDITDINE